MPACSSAPCTCSRTPATLCMARHSLQAGSISGGKAVSTRPVRIICGANQAATSAVEGSQAASGLAKPPSRKSTPSATPAKAATKGNGNSSKDSGKKSTRSSSKGSSSSSSKAAKHEHSIERATGELRSAMSVAVLVKSARDMPLALLSDPNAISMVAARAARLLSELPKTPPPVAAAPASPEQEDTSKSSDSGPPADIASQSAATATAAAKSAAFTYFRLIKMAKAAAKEAKQAADAATISASVAVGDAKETAQLLASAANAWAASTAEMVRELETKASMFDKAAKAAEVASEAVVKAARAAEAEAALASAAAQAPVLVRPSRPGAPSGAPGAKPPRPEISTTAKLDDLLGLEALLLDCLASLLGVTLQPAATKPGGKAPAGGKQKQAEHGPSSSSASSPEGSAVVNGAGADAQSSQPGREPSDNMTSYRTLDVLVSLVKVRLLLRSWSVASAPDVQSKLGHVLVLPPELLVRLQKQVASSKTLQEAGKGKHPWLLAMVRPREPRPAPGPPGQQQQPAVVKDPLADWKVRQVSPSTSAEADQKKQAPAPAPAAKPVVQALDPAIVAAVEVKKRYLFDLQYLNAALLRVDPLAKPVQPLTMTPSDCELLLNELVERYSAGWELDAQQVASIKSSKGVAKVQALSSAIRFRQFSALAASDESDSDIAAEEVDGAQGMGWAIGKREDARVLELREQLAACASLEQLEGLPALKTALDANRPWKYTGQSAFDLVQRAAEIACSQQQEASDSDDDADSATASAPLSPSLLQLLSTILISAMPVFPVQQLQPLLAALAALPGPALLPQLGSQGLADALRRRLMTPYGLYYLETIRDEEHEQLASLVQATGFHLQHRPVVEQLKAFRARTEAMNLRKQKKVAARQLQQQQQQLQQQLQQQQEQLQQQLLELQQQQQRLQQQLQQGQEPQLEQGHEQGSGEGREAASAVVQVADAAVIADSELESSMQEGSDQEAASAAADEQQVAADVPATVSSSSAKRAAGGKQGTKVAKKAAAKSNRDRILEKWDWYYQAFWARFIDNTIDDEEQPWQGAAPVSPEQWQEDERWRTEAVMLPGWIIRPEQDARDLRRRAAAMPDLAAVMQLAAEVHTQEARFLLEDNSLLFKLEMLKEFLKTGQMTVEQVNLPFIEKTWSVAYTVKALDRVIAKLQDKSYVERWLRFDQKTRANFVLNAALKHRLPELLLAEQAGGPQGNGGQAEVVSISDQSAEASSGDASAADHGRVLSQLGAWMKERTLPPTFGIGLAALQNLTDQLMNGKMGLELVGVSVTDAADGDGFTTLSDRELILSQLETWISEYSFEPTHEVSVALVQTLGSQAVLDAVPAPEYDDPQAPEMRFMEAMVPPMLLLPDDQWISDDDVSRWLQRMLPLGPDCLCRILNRTQQLIVSYNALGSDKWGQLVRGGNGNDQQQLGSADGQQPDSTDEQQPSSTGGQQPGSTAGLDGTQSVPSSSEDVEPVHPTLLLLDTRLKQLLSVSPAAGLDAVVALCLYRICFAGPEVQRQGEQLTQLTMSALTRLDRVARAPLLPYALAAACRHLQRVPSVMLTLLTAVPDSLSSAATQMDRQISTQPSKTVAKGLWTAKRAPANTYAVAVGAAVEHQLKLHADGAESGESATATAQAGAEGQPLSHSQPLSPLDIAATLVKSSWPRCGVALPLQLYEKVAEAALESGKGDLALRVLTAAFSTGQVVSPSKTVSDQLLSCIVRHAPAAAESSGSLDCAALLSAAQATGPRHCSLLVQGLMAASVRERSGAWARAAVGVATVDGITPRLLSSLVDTYVQPVVSNMASGEDQRAREQGTEAVLLALQLLANAAGNLQQHPQLVAMPLPTRQALAAWLLQHKVESHREGSAHDTVAALLPLALELSPTVETARQLLQRPEASLSSSNRRQVMRLLGAQHSPGQGQLLLTYLNSISGEQQRDLLREGGAATIATQLVADAAEAATGHTTYLSQLMGFLQTHVEVAGGEAHGSSRPRVALSREEWRRVFASVLDLCDRTRSSEVQAAAEQMVELAQAEQGAQGSGAGQGNQTLASTAWLVEECLLRDKLLRKVPSLSLARSLLEGLSSSGWGFRQNAADSAQQPISAAPGPQAMQSVKAGVDLLLWMAGKRALVDTGSDAPWLAGVMADLCAALASVGPSWAVRVAQDQQALLFTAQLCAGHGADLALVDLLQAHRQNVGGKVPRDAAKLAVASVVEQGMWSEGSYLLKSLGLDLAQWATDQSVMQCREALAQLPTAQALAVLSVLVNDAAAACELDPSTAIRALSAVCAHSERQLLLVNGSQSSASNQQRSTLLSTLLMGRQAAAGLASQLSGGQATPGDHMLDPAWHCQEAERVVRLDIQAALPWPSAVDIDMLLQLLSVFEAAQRPVYAVRLGLEVASGVLEVAPSLSGSDGMSVVTSAMGISNQGGYYEGAVLLLEELLTARGEVDDTEVMAQVVTAVDKADGSQQEALLARVVKAVGERGYYSMESCSMDPGAASGSSTNASDEAPERPQCDVAVIVAKPEFLAQQRQRRLSQRQMEWSKLPLDWVAATVDGSSSDASDDDGQEEDEGGMQQEDSTEEQFVVALLGGKEFKQSDELMLRRQHGNAKLLWYGSSRDVGLGNFSENGLVQKIKAGRVNLVYIQTRHNGHTATGKVMAACRSHGVQFHMVSTGVKAMLKAEPARARDSA